MAPSSSAARSDVSSPGSRGGPDLAQLRKDEPRTAVEMWKRRVAATPEKPAFQYHQDGGWKRMNWREADKAAREIAAGLVARGVVPGDRICVLAQTRLEWILCDIGILLA